MECYLQNHWPTKNITTLSSDSVEAFCHMLLDKLMEVKVRAQESIDTITSYRDKVKAYQVNEFLTMTDTAYKLLLPLQESDYDKQSIDFHNLPDPLPEEVKEEEPPQIDINDNPLYVDQYAIDTFGLTLTQQALLTKWLDLPN